MAITSYSTLKTAIEAWTHRSDLSSVVDDFIDIAESRMNRELRVSQQETVTTLSAGALTVSLPADCLAIRNIKLTTNPLLELQYISPMEMDRLDQEGVELSTYTIVGDDIRLNATSSTDLTVVYYAKVPALTDAAPTNWMLESNPDAYLYGALAEAFKYSMDDEQAAKYSGMFSESIALMKRLDRARKTGQAMRVRVA